MSEFKNKSITSKGLELLARALAGEQLTFTKIEMGSGAYEGNVGEATQLTQPQQPLLITNLTRKGGQVTLSAGFKIEDITNSFEWSEIGVYAKGEDDVETLYMYGYTQDSSFVSKDSLNEKLINITVMVSNATNISATVNNSLVYLTAEALENHTKDMSTHQDIRDKVSELGKQLEEIEISWEKLGDKPTEFPPSQHNHSVSNVEGLQQALESKAPTHSHPYASTTHAHTKSDIGLSNVPNYSATSSVSDSSTSKFATASAVKQAYDKAVEAVSNTGTATKCYKPSNTVRVSKPTKRSATFRNECIITTWTPKYSGYIKVSADMYCSSDVGFAYIYAIGTEPMTVGGDYTRRTYLSAVNYFLPDGSITNLQIDSSMSMAYGATGETTSENKVFYTYVQAGKPIAFIAAVSSNAQTGHYSNFTISYDEEKIA